MRIAKNFHFVGVYLEGRWMRETHEETLLREIKEEYDLDVKNEDCTYITDYPISGNKVYICNVDSSQEPKLGEGLSMKWMTIDEIEILSLGFDQENLIQSLKQYIK